MKKSTKSTRIAGKKDKDSIVVIDNVSILTVFAIVKTKQLTLLDSKATQAIYKALIRSTKELSENSTPDQMAEYLQRYDGERLQGLINNVKGITFEILTVDAENVDGDAIYAELSEKTNQEAIDALYYNEETGEVSEIQFKATLSDDVVDRFQEQHPDIEVIQTTPDELEELTKHTEDTIDALKEGADDTFDYIPSFSAVMMALVAAPIMKDYWTQKIDKDEAKKKMVSSLGSRVGSSAAKLFLLSTPMAPAVISWSLWRISSVLIRVASNKRQDLLNTI